MASITAAKWFSLVIIVTAVQSVIEAASVNITGCEWPETVDANESEDPCENGYCPGANSNDTVFNVTKIILKEVDSNNIRNTLRILSESPHLAGTEQDDKLARYIERQWKRQGLDLVHKVTYKTVLSYPDPENPNKVYLLDANGNITFTSKHMEDILRPEDEHPDLVDMFNAYSPNGTAEGELVYANFAMDSDFQTLLKLGINVTGKIVIAKYGLIYRGNKAYLAEKYGAIGIILFSDPSEHAQDGQEPEQVYPNKWWLQSSGAQRGSLWAPTGDPVTPRYPSIDDAYRVPLKDAGFVKIPCQPIGYKDAEELLKLLDGKIAPEYWQGPIPTILRLGPKFVNNTPNVKVRLVVNNYLKTVDTTNVIGIIKGSTEPDRYVMHGNHRDSWGFGAVDASSGTAQMLEVSRLFGKLVKKGWRPKRTIMFLSWGAEEYGLIGSTEFVEDNLLKLSSRGVVYINTDICTSGEAFSVFAAPMLNDFVINITKQVPAPKNQSETLYDSWKEYEISKQAETGESRDITLRVGDLRGGTDHIPFAIMAGVNFIDWQFAPSKLNRKRSFSSYPAYHTGFDTFHYMDKLIDPEFVHHKACSHFNGLLLHALADAEILPFNLTNYVDSINRAFKRLKRDGIYDKILNHSIKIDRLGNALKNFEKAAGEWMVRLQTMHKQNLSELALRILNDQLIHLDQAFLLSEGLPMQKQFRHVVFSLSLHNYYTSNGFPGLRDLLFEIDSADDPEATWTEVEKHVSDIIIAMHKATNFLQPVHVI